MKTFKEIEEIVKDIIEQPELDKFEECDILQDKEGDIFIVGRGEGRLGCEEIGYVSDGEINLY